MYPLVQAPKETLKDPARQETLRTLLERIKAGKKEKLFSWKEGSEWKSLSSDEFIEKVRALACYLRDIPSAHTPEKPMVQKGDRVAFFIYNGPEWHIVRSSCAKIGAISIPILTEASDHDLEIILKKSSPKILIVKDTRHEQRLRDLLKRLDIHIPVMRYTVHTPLPQTALIGFYEKVKPDDCAMIFFTSGTTSDPKGVMHTHRSLLSNVEACRALFDVGQDDVVLSFLPVSHIFQQAVDTLALDVGATIVYVEDPRQVVTALPEIQPTLMASVPRMFELIAGMVPLRIKKRLAAQGAFKQILVPFAMKMGERNYSRSFVPRIFARISNPLLRPVRKKIRREIFGPQLRFVVSGGAPLPYEVGAFIQGALELPIYQGWGMTEVAGAGAVNTPKFNVLGSCGRVLPGTQIQIRREHLEPDFLEDLPPDEGEIFIRGPIVTQGYYEEKEATAETIHDGWLKTGDIGKIDKKGALWITGRAKSVIVLENGLKVHEEALAARIRSSCPLIEQIVIFGHKKPHLVALVYPNALLLKEGVTEPHRTKEGAWTPAVKNAIAAALKQAPLAPHEKIKDFRLLGTPLNTEDGTLTPSQKPRHRVILEKYDDLVESMYK